MGWLDANEYLLMEAMARDRVDDLRASVDLALASTEAEPTCAVCERTMGRTRAPGGPARGSPLTLG